MPSAPPTSPPATIAATTTAPAATIAAKMLAAVPTPGCYTRTKVANGLDIILHRIDAHRWRLALAREGEFPSPDEVATWRTLLAVPVSAEPQRTYKQHTHPKTRRPILYHVVELTWREYSYTEATA